MAATEKSGPQGRIEYCFEDYRLSTVPLRLWRGGEEQPIQPQPARLLAILLARAGEVVSREELKRGLWSEGTYLDHEQAINFAVRKLRALLDDDPARPRFIETVPRVGYRFIAAVRAENPESSAGKATPSWLGARSWSAWLPPVLGVLLLLINVWVVAGKALVGPSTCGGLLAVQPLAGPTEISGSLTAELLAQLVNGQSSGLAVLATATEGPGALSAEAAHYLLSGTVRQAGDKLRITLRLWRQDDAVQVWGEVYDCSAGELQTWPATASRAVRGALGLVRVARQTS